MGLSKDGRPIYSPYYDNGKSYHDCEVDVCNGLWLQGNYGYVATFFHPYVMGCYGPGNYPVDTQSCSGRPRDCRGNNPQSEVLFYSGAMTLSSVLLLLTMTELI